MTENRLLIIVLLLVIAWPFAATALRAFVRRGFPDSTPPFDGGDGRLNRAFFLESMISGLVLLPCLIAIVLIDDTRFEAMSAFETVVLIIAVVWCTDPLKKLIKNLFGLTILDELSGWKEQRARQMRSMRAGQRRFQKDARKRRFQINGSEA